MAIRKHYSMLLQSLLTDTCFGVVKSLMDMFLLLRSKLLFPLAEEFSLPMRPHFRAEVLEGNVAEKKKKALLILIQPSGLSLNVIST